MAGDLTLDVSRCERPHWGVALLLVLLAASVAEGVGTHSGDDVSLDGGTTLVT
jgi:hypothetical protein